MFELTSLLLFFGAALLIAISPGPGIFYVAARTLSGGRAEGLASSLGTGMGGLVHVAAGALGVSALLLASAEAFTLLKLIGATYLVYLGVRSWRAAAEPVALASLDPQGAGRAFREGVVVEALNPKTAAFFLAFIPQFVEPASGPGALGVAAQFLVLGLVSVTLNTVADVGVTFGAARLRERLGVKSIALLRRISGGVLCGLGVTLALARR